MWTNFLKDEYSQNPFLHKKGDKNHRLEVARRCYWNIWWGLWWGVSCKNTFHKQSATIHAGARLLHPHNHSQGSTICFTQNGISTHEKSLSSHCRTIACIPPHKIMDKVFYKADRPPKPLHPCRWLTAYPRPHPWAQFNKEARATGCDFRGTIGTILQIELIW